MRKIVQACVRILCYSLAMVLVLFALISILFKVFSPAFNHEKPQFEALMSRVLHHPVHVGQVEVAWRALGPVFIFHNVTVDEASKAFVHATQFRCHVAVFESLYRKHLVLQSVTLRGVQLEVQLGQGEILVNDRSLATLTQESEPTAEPMFAWLGSHFFAQSDHVTIYYRDAAQGEETVHINHLRGQPVNGQVQLSVKGYLNDQRKQAFAAEVQFGGESLQPSTWRGKAYLEISRLSLVNHAWINSQLNAPVTQGELSTRTWLDWQGLNVSHAISQLHVKQLELGDLSIEYHGMADYTRDASSAWRVLLQSKKGGLVELSRQGQLSSLWVNQLSVEDLLAGYRLFSKRALPDVMAWQPKGQLVSLSLTQKQDDDTPARLQYQADFNHFSVTSPKQSGSLESLSGSIKGQLDQATVQLDSQKVMLFGVPVEQASANLQWQQTALGQQFTATDVTLRNEAAQFTMNATVHQAVEDDPSIDAQGYLEVSHSRQLFEWLPASVAKTPLVRWLSGAVLSGQGGLADFSYQGRLADFPVTKTGDGLKLHAVIAPSTLQFSKIWPALETLSLSLDLDQNTLLMQLISGTSAGVPLTSGSARIDDLYHHPLMQVDVAAKGSAAALMPYIQQSPLAKRLGSEITQVDGTFGVHAHLNLPLQTPEALALSGEVRIQQGSVMAAPFTLDAIDGVVHFTDQSLSGKAIQARLMGDPLSVDVSTDKTAGMTLSLLGVVNAQHWASLVDAFSLTDVLQGVTDYQAKLQFPFAGQGSGASAIVESQLKGMTINLPDSLGKGGDVTQPLSIHVNTPAIHQAPIDFVASLESTFQAKGRYDPMQRQFSGDINVASLLWPLSPLDQLFSASNSSWTVNQLKVTAPTGELFGVKVSNPEMTLQTKAGKQQCQLNSGEAKGEVIFPSKAGDPVLGHFDYLIVSQGLSGVSEESHLKVSALPPLVLDVDRMTYRQLYLGKFHLKTLPVTQGVRIEKLSTASSLFDLTMRGVWQQQSQAEQSFFEGEMVSENVGQTLNAFAIAKGLKAKQGRAQFNLSWSGAPYDFSLSKTHGVLRLNMHDGLIPTGPDSMTMGLGKVLSLFSMDSLKKRLRLDFSDFKESGYSFNILDATANIDDGQAEMTQSYFDGPEAKVAFEGQVGLLAKNYDLTLAITPYVTSSLPLIATLAGGPVAGIATYAVDKVMDKQIQKLTTYHYQLTGLWQAPVLSPLEVQK